MSSEKQIKVLYNSACPICDAGIRAEQQRMQGCDVRWLDVHTNPDSLKETGLDLEFVRQRLHVIDAKDDPRIGIDAFIALWQAAPSQHWKARLLSLPVIHGLSALAYNVFAWLLYRFNRAIKRW
jgi:predicted DCC family thiol-disulfide oxidoreductase YuxK